MAPKPVQHRGFYASSHPVDLPGIQITMQHRMGQSHPRPHIKPMGHSLPALPIPCCYCSSNPEMVNKPHKNLMEERITPLGPTLHHSWRSRTGARTPTSYQPTRAHRVPDTATISTWEIQNLARRPPLPLLPAHTPYPPGPTLPNTAPVARYIHIGQPQMAETHRWKNQQPH